MVGLTFWAGHQRVLHRHYRYIVSDTKLRSPLRKHFVYIFAPLGKWYTVWKINMCRIQWYLFAMRRPGQCWPKIGLNTTGVLSFGFTWHCRHCSHPFQIFTFKNVLLHEYIPMSNKTIIHYLIFCFSPARGWIRPKKGDILTLAVVVWFLSVIPKSSLVFHRDFIGVIRIWHCFIFTPQRVEIG